MTAGLTIELDTLAAVPTERLEAEICSLAAHLAAGEHRWLALIGEYEARRGYEHWGMSSATVWLSWQCGLSPHAAKERVRVATALRSLPLIDAAFAAGELTYSKVRALVRVADAPTEAMFVEMARHATASQLERLLAGYRKALAGNPRYATEPERQPDYRFHWYVDDSAHSSCRTGCHPRTVRSCSPPCKRSRTGLPPSPTATLLPTARRRGLSGPRSRSSTSPRRR